jgi:ketosteroid isomerase-like protein
MRILLTIVVTTCFCCGAIAGKRGNPGESNTEVSATDDSSAVLMNEFRRLAEVWKQAYNTREAANLLPLYAQDAEYISAHVDCYIAHGRDAVIRNFQKGIDGGGYLESLEVLSMKSSCDIATIVSRYRGTAAGHDVDGRNLLVWKRIDGKWLVVTHMTAVQE